jgi:hypothetical protein
LEALAPASERFIERGGIMWRLTLTSSERERRGGNEWVCT